MTLKVAIQMDPLGSIDVASDSTFLLGLEAQARGYQLYHYLPENLTLNESTVLAAAQKIKLKNNQGEHFQAQEIEWINLEEVDVVLMRQDPPFDMAYITATHILEKICENTLVVNNPVSVRNSPEKIFVTKFPELMPPTIISKNIDSLTSFRAKYKDLIIKPLFGNGGAGVFHIGPNDENFYSLLEFFFKTYREPVIAQRYESSVREGDKRIILIDGEPVGALNRIPPDGDSRSNLHIGGRAEKGVLTGRDKEICEIIGPHLRDLKLLFVGIDVIGTVITEINVTSPTCLQEINRFNHVKLETKIWDSIETKLTG